MNPFGTTRQDVGGETKDTLRKKLFRAVPFGPCHIPPFMVQWPKAATGEPRLLDPFEQCMAAGDTLQNPIPGLIIPAPDPPIPNPPPAANPSVLPSSSGTQIWFARINVSGLAGMTIISSDLYSGPLRVTGLYLRSFANAGGGLIGTIQIGASPVPVLNQFKVPFGTALPQGSIFRTITADETFSAQQQQGGPTPVFGYERMFNQDFGSGGPSITSPVELQNLKIDILSPEVYFWLALNNVTNFQDRMQCYVVFDPLPR